MGWLLLIYTLPPEPTRKRAFVWRLLKKLGAVYLRDGICVLPDQAETRAGLREVADKVHEFGGQASLAEGARLDDATADSVRQRAFEARQAEYAALVEAGASLVAHIRREARHRELADSEMRVLAGDLVKLQRWRDQIRARDFFSGEGAADAERVLGQCQATLDGVEVGSGGVPETAR